MSCRSSWSLLLAMLLNISPRKFVQVGALTQPDLLRFFRRRINGPPVTQHAANHPECPDADAGGAVDKCGAILRIVRYPQKLRDLFVFWITKGNGNIKIAQAQFFCLCFFFSRTMLATLPKVDNGFHAILL